MSKPTTSAASDREARLKAALKANMQRRKAQAKGRAKIEEQEKDASETSEQKE